MQHQKNVQSYGRTVFRSPSTGRTPPITPGRPPYPPQTLNRFSPGRPPYPPRRPSYPPGRSPYMHRRPPKKKKNWIPRVAIAAVIILLIVGIFLVLYFLVFTKSGDNGGGGNGGNGGGGEITPPAGAPYQAYGGSGGACSVDTDCPVIFRRIDNETVPFTQYCINPNNPDKGTANLTGVCITNKECTVNSDCYSLPGVEELTSCDLTGEEPSPCRFTVGCGGGYCRRIQCKTSTDCGLSEACTVNDPLGDSYGYCLSIGNECTNNTLAGGPFQCWGGYFGCTGIQGNSNPTGYCTECSVGSGPPSICNVSNNGLSGPGAICDYLSSFDTLSTANSSAELPASCKMIDNFNYNSCPSKSITSLDAIKGSVIYNNTTCCEGSGGSKCGQTCLDDYQCDDYCPYCVGQFRTSEKICSCTKISPYQYNYNTGTSTYSCLNGYGVTITDQNFADLTNPNIEMIKNNHSCIVTLKPNCIDNYGPTNNGDINCNPSAPYCNLSSGVCSTDLEGSRCYISEDGNRDCYTYDLANHTFTVDPNYVCDINNICTKRLLQAGENCFGKESSCDEGLICSSVLAKEAPDNSIPRKICIANGFQ